MKSKLPRYENSFLDRRNNLSPRMINPDSLMNRKYLLMLLNIRPIITAISFFVTHIHTLHRTTFTLI